MDKKTGTGQRAKGKGNLARAFHLSLLIVLCTLSLSPLAFRPASAFGAEKWSGVDEAVVEKVAREHGREASPPLINTDQGDLLLFVFLLAGAVGGFAAGYYWRVLVEGRSKEDTPS